MWFQSLLGDCPPSGHQGLVPSDALMRRHWSRVGEGRLSRSGGELLMSLKCIQRMHQAPDAENTEWWTSFSIGLTGGDKRGNMLSYLNNADLHDVRIPPGCTVVSAGSGFSWDCLHAVKFLIEQSKRSRPLRPLMPPFIVRRADSFCPGGWWWMTLKDWCRSLELCHTAVSQKAEQVGTGTEESICTRKWLLIQLLAQKNLGLWIEKDIRIHTQNVGPCALSQRSCQSSGLITEPMIRTWDTNVASLVIRYSFVPQWSYNLKRTN